MNKDQYYDRIYEIANKQDELLASQKKLRKSSKIKTIVGYVEIVLTIAALVTAFGFWNSTVIAGICFAICGLTSAGSIVSFILSAVDDRKFYKGNKELAELSKEKKHLIDDLCNLNNPIVTNLKTAPTYVRTLNRQSKIKEDKDSNGLER